MARKRGDGAGRLALQGDPGGAAARGADAAARRWTSSSGRSTCWRRASRCARRSSAGVPGSMIFWGPPGSGKTTLAHLVASTTARVFVAVQRGLRGRAADPGDRGRGARRGSTRAASQTILFVDEIHRLNKAQQDSLLPPSEDGTITLIGATTENPSFEINGALLSRTRVFVLQPLARGARRGAAAARAGGRGARAGRRWSSGSRTTRSRPSRSRRTATRAGRSPCSRRPPRTWGRAAPITPRGGARGDAEALRPLRQGGRGALQSPLAPTTSRCGAAIRRARSTGWRGCSTAGEDPMTLFRRAIAMAAEDIGLADPNALVMAVAARDAFHMLGPPEGYLPLAEMTIYLATAPKSNSAKVALGEALAAAQETPAAPVPLHIRNAPTGLMKELGYGKGYQLRPRFAGRVPAAGVPAGRAAGHGVLHAGRVRVREAGGGADGVVGAEEAGRGRGRSEGEGRTGGLGDSAGRIPRCGPGCTSTRGRTGRPAAGVSFPGGEAPCGSAVRRACWRWLPRLGGCAGLGNALKEPDVRLDRVVVREVGVRGGELDLMVEVGQPQRVRPPGHRGAAGLRRAGLARGRRPVRSTTSAWTPATGRC